MELPILGQEKDTPNPAKDFRNCAGCARITVCHPGVVIEADAAPVDESKRCATFVPVEAVETPGNDSLH